MNTLILVAIINVYITATNCRLIQKNTEKTAVTKPAENPVVRVTRAIYEDDAVTVFSKEDELSTTSRERTLFDNRGPHITFNPKFTREIKKIYRIARDSNETPSTTVSNSTELPKQIVTQRIVLVNKPIPTFNGIDYDDDFQLKVIRSPTKYLVDSSEHEDEDFNLDDYDFDINHDEYSGRGKHLEPRIKNKHLLEQQALEEQGSLAPLQTKNILAPVTKIISKRNFILEKVADKMKEDYYDDYMTSTETAEQKHKTREIDDELKENSDSESREYNVKTARMIRNLASLEDKTPTIVTQFMDFLPTTRQMKFENKSSLSSIEAV